MNTEDKIIAFLARAETRPAPSKLDAYHQLIRTLRQRRWTYKEIAMALRVEFGVSAAPSTIHAFVNVRSKRPPSSSTDGALESHLLLRKPRFRLDA